MQLTAVVDGKRIRYDAAATFVVEERVGRRYHVIAHKDNIESAVSKYRRLHEKGAARLSEAVNGRVKHLITGR